MRKLTCKVNLQKVLTGKRTIVNVELRFELHKGKPGYTYDALIFLNRRHVGKK